MKKLTLLAFVGALFLSTSLFASDSCRWSYRIASAAEDLSHSAEQFDYTIDRITGYSHLSQDTHKLQRAADHLKRLANRNVSSCSHLRNDYRNVVTTYRHLREEFRQAHRAHNNYQAEHDWEEVSHAFRGLRQTLNGGRGGGRGHGRGHGRH